MTTWRANKTTAWPLDWDWSHRDPDGNRQVAVNLLPDLSRAMIMNPGLKLHIQQGYYDLATPFAATNYYIRHNPSCIHVFSASSWDIWKSLGG